MLVTINQKIEKLQSVNQHMDGYRNVIKGRDEHDVCTPFQIFEIHQRCALLCMAYVNACEKMNAVTWKECCCLACQQLNGIDIEQTVNWEVIKKWNILF